MNNLQAQIQEMGNAAVVAARNLAISSARKKNAFLEAMADALDSRRDEIKEANKQDIANAQKDGLAPALIDRLTLDDARIEALIKGVRTIVTLKDPVGETISRWVRPNGLVITKRRVPIGVIAIIYEARPNVTVDAAVLCLKTANAVILRGGKEALQTNTILARIMQESGQAKGMPENSVQLITTTEHEAVQYLCQLEGKVDLVIPRGGEGLIRAVTNCARVPVIKHYKGICHVFVDESANLDMALAIVENAKCQRPGVCNALETLLVHEKVAPQFLPLLAKKIPQVEIRGDATTQAIIPGCKAATEDDWHAEYLAMILAVKVVPDLTAAIEHINSYGSHHSDSIVTEDDRDAQRFVNEVDSAAVYVNASTRFTDGGEFGMGAEIGISTDKLHARGPMGLEELTTYKYIVTGNGQIRE